LVFVLPLLCAVLVTPSASVSANAALRARRQHADVHTAQGANHDEQASGAVDGSSADSDEDASAEDADAKREDLLAQRDDLKAQLATKASEFLKQHRRADRLEKQVHALEAALKAEKKKEQVQTARLNRARAKLRQLSSEAAADASALEDTSSGKPIIALVVVGESTPDTRPPPPQPHKNVTMPQKHDGTAAPAAGNHHAPPSRSTKKAALSAKASRSRSKAKAQEKADTAQKHKGVRRSKPVKAVAGPKGQHTSTASTKLAAVKARKAAPPKAAHALPQHVSKPKTATLVTKKVAKAANPTRQPSHAVAAPAAKAQLPVAPPPAAPHPTLSLLGVDAADSAVTEEAALSSIGGAEPLQEAESSAQTLLALPPVAGDAAEAADEGMGGGGGLASAGGEDMVEGGESASGADFADLEAQFKEESN